MKRKHTHRGAGLVEMLVATLVALILGAGLLGLLRANVIGVSVTTGQVAADYRARRPLDLLTDAMRNAVSYTSSGTKKVVSAATTDSVTVYTDTAGTTAKYWRDGTTTPPTLKRTVGTTTTILVRGVQSLKLTYYKVTDGYNGTAWSTTATDTAPTNAEMPFLGSVKVETTVNVDGYTRTMSSVVRLRNSPL